MAIPAAPQPAQSAAADHRLENWVFPTLGERSRIAVLYLYYLTIILALLWLYGWGDFTTAPFVYQGF